VLNIFYLKVNNINTNIHAIQSVTFALLYYTNRIICNFQVDIDRIFYLSKILFFKKKNSTIEDSKMSSLCNSDTTSNFVELQIAQRIQRLVDCLQQAEYIKDDLSCSNKRVNLSIFK